MGERWPWNGGVPANVSFRRRLELTSDYARARAALNGTLARLHHCRFASRNIRTWRTASGIVSFSSFHG
jgi:hypothetical protein